MDATSWAVIKQFANTYKASIQWIDIGTAYFLKAFSGQFELEYTLTKDGGSDQSDFEANYKTNGNQSLDQLDSDGASFSRVKQAPTGWTFHMRGIEFTTALLGSLVNNDSSNTALTDATITFYDASGNVITDQTTADSSCVKTVLDLEPHYDYYIIGGTAKIAATPTNDVRLNAVAVPDIPAGSGGSKVLLQNINFKFIGSLGQIDADGRASKQLVYSSTYHTNKIRFTLYHNAGDKNTIAIFVEYYRQ